MAADPIRRRGGYRKAAPASKCGNSALLAGLLETQLWPFLDRGAQIPGVAREKHRHPVMVFGAGRRIADPEALELGRVVGFEPARGLIGRPVEPGREPV